MSRRRQVPKRGFLSARRRLNRRQLEVLERIAYLLEQLQPGALPDDNPERSGGASALPLTTDRLHPKSPREATQSSGDRPTGSTNAPGATPADTLP